MFVKVKILMISITLNNKFPFEQPLFTKKKRTACPSQEKKDKRKTSSQIHFLLLTTTQKTEERRGVEVEGVKKWLDFGRLSCNENRSWCGRALWARLERRYRCASHRLGICSERIRNRRGHRPRRASWKR